MVNLDNIVQGVSRRGAVSGFAGGLAGTALAGAFTGKKGRNVSKSALNVGAWAAVGGLAYTACRRYQQNGSQSAGTPAPATASVIGSSGTATQAGPRRWDHIGREGFESIPPPATTHYS